MCLYDVRLSSLATSFGVCICMVLIVFIYLSKMFSLLCVLVTCFGFHKDLCVYAIVYMFSTMFYVPYACIFVCICNYVCMYVCVSLYILRIVYCFHYSECLESPITQETNCKALSFTSVRIVTKNSVHRQNRSGQTYFGSQNWFPLANFGPPSENVNPKQFKS